MGVILTGQGFRLCFHGVPQRYGDDSDMKFDGYEGDGCGCTSIIISGLVLWFLLKCLLSLL